MNKNNPSLLTPDQIEQFKCDGFLLLRNFYSVEQIEPICRRTYEIIGQVIDEYNLPITRKPYAYETFDDGYLDVIKINRRYGGVIYDAVKQIPTFLRLVAEQQNEELFNLLRPGAVAGVAAGGFGIRINNPFEEKYRAAWHQEYPGQLRSLNGLVFWSPLIHVQPENGPVDILVASHHEGLLPLIKNQSDIPEQTGGYAARLHNEQSVVAKYNMVAPCISPGDVLIMDFMVLHRSGQNISNRALWSMQFRWFDFSEPVGRKHSWVGSYAAGVDFSDIHPELCVNRELV